MCLYIAKDADAQIASEDITVYKVLIKNAVHLGHHYYYISPYQHKPYEIGFLYSSPISFGEATYGIHKNSYWNDLFAGLKEYEYDTYIDEIPAFAIRTVEQGLHSFASLEDAQHFATLYDSDDVVVMKCTIPAGAAYYEGKWMYDIYPNDKLETLYVKNYASSRLRTEEVV